MTSTLYIAGACVLAFFCVFLLLRKAKHKLVILAFDRVETPRQINQLRRLLAFLKKHHFTAILPQQLSRKLPPKPVLLVFFGGYRSFYTTVFPLLSSEKTAASLFVPPAWLGQYNGWQRPPWQDILTVAELKKLAKNPFIAIGALTLQAQDINTLNSTEAAFAFSESLHRLKNERLAPQAIALWPAKRVALPHTPHDFLIYNLPVFGPRFGINQIEKPAKLLRIVAPQTHPLLTWFILWKQRA